MEPALGVALLAVLFVGTHVGLATAAVRFVVTADGKELYRSKPMTSLDAPIGASIKLADVKSLTLKVESTAGEAFTTPGTWGDASLVK